MNDALAEQRADYDTENKAIQEEIAETCECGDTSDMHVDGCEQCFVIGCGCREFTFIEALEEHPLV